MTSQAKQLRPGRDGRVTTWIVVSSLAAIIVLSLLGRGVVLLAIPRGAG